MFHAGKAYAAIRRSISRFYVHFFLWQAFPVGA